jgi:hypothetical protein
MIPSIMQQLPLWAQYGLALAPIASAIATFIVALIAASIAYA